MKLNSLSPYDNRVMEYMNEIQPEVWKNLDLVPCLPEITGKRLLAYFVKLACEPTHIRPIMIGREAVAEMPREWVLQHIEAIANMNINLKDDWEFRRLCELYSLLDTKLVDRLVAVGLKSGLPDVIEAAIDFSHR